MAMKSITALLRNHIRNFAAARDGNIALIFGLAALPLMTAAGAAVDFSRSGATKAAMQTALDSAALNLVQDAGTLPGANLAPRATALFTAMFNKPEAQNVQVTAQFDPETVTLTLNGSAVLPTTFMGIVGVKSMQIAALSKAREAAKSACVIALDNFAPGAFKVNGGGTVSVPNCGIHVNSSAGNALFQTGPGWIKAKSITVVGGANSGNYSPTPQVIKKVLADPLSSIVEPTIPGSCTYNKKDFDTAITLPGGSVYCGNIHFNANVTFGPGIHYFREAKVKTASNISMTAQNAMLHFSSDSDWDSSGAGKISFSPMLSGIYAGIAIFGARSDTKLPIFKLTGNKDYSVSGTIYLPKQILQLRGDADLSVTSKSGYVIAQQFSYDGNSNFTFDAFGGVPATWALSGSALVQ
jgi:Flp pilus assembly protein TadG